MRQDITTTPEPLAGVTAGRRYTIQNLTGRTLYIQTVAAAPTNADAAFRMAATGPLSAGAFSIIEGERVWVWVDPTDRAASLRSAGGAGFVVYDEAA